MVDSGKRELENPKLVYPPDPIEQFLLKITAPAISRIESGERVKRVVSKQSFYESLGCITIVCGGYFGDEAKGKIVHLLIEREGTTFVVRTNSGANAGHTVVTKSGEKIVTHLTPSGITNANIKNIIGMNCFLDPLGYYHGEVEELRNHGLDLNNLFIDNAHIVTPYHILEDLSRGLASTGKGMSQVAKDKVLKTGIRLEDLINIDNNLSVVKKNFDLWENYFKKYNIEENLKKNPVIKIPAWLEPFLKLNKEERLNWFLQEFSKIKQFYTDRYANGLDIVNKEIKEGNNGVFEGAQSYFLSNDIPTHHKSGTSSGTHALGTLASFPIANLDLFSIISVLKVPSSRVGLGENVSGLVPQDWFEKSNLDLSTLKDCTFEFAQVYDEYISCISKKGILENKESTCLKIKGMKINVSEALAIAQSIHFQELGATTKRPRVTGFFDLLHAKDLVKTQGQTISLSCIDRYLGLKELCVVEKYSYEGPDYITNSRKYEKGNIITLEDSLPNSEVQKYCIPIFKILSGFNYIVDKEGKLHPNLEKFLIYIEDKTGARITSIGTGPKTDQIIFLD